MLLGLTLYGTRCNSVVEVLAQHTQGARFHSQLHKDNTRLSRLSISAQPPFHVMLWPLYVHMCMRLFVCGVYCVCMQMLLLCGSPLT